MSTTYKNTFVQSAVENGKKDLSALEGLMEKGNVRKETMMSFILGGYYDAMQGAAQAIGKDADLTYDTISDLNAALIALANIQHSDYEPAENADVTMKTLAAYLMLLAIETGDLKVTVKVGRGTNYPYKSAMWADMFYVELGDRKKTDLLPAAKAGLRNAPMEVENGIFLNVDPLVAAYKKLTGIDLAEFGLANIIVQFTDTKH